MVNAKLISAKFLRAVAVLAALMTTAAMPAAAEAAEPWWGITTSSRPTHVSKLENEVQELHKGSGVTLVELEGGAPEHYIACMGSPVCSFIVLPDDETAEELQRSLEEPAVYGAGNVKVEEEPSGSGRFVITAIGSDADRYHVQAVLHTLGTESRTRVLADGGNRVVLTVADVGDAPVVGEDAPVSIRDTLPADVTAEAVEGVAGAAAVGLEGNAGPVSCSVETEHVVGCTFEGSLPAYEAIEVEVNVHVEESVHTATTSVGEVSVTGGGAAPASVQQPIEISEQAAPFGAHAVVHAEAEGGAPVTQAGAHPFQLSTVLQFNQGPIVPFPTAQGGESFSRHESKEETSSLPRNVRLKLPAGFLGNPTVVPQCSEAAFLTDVVLQSGCPADSAIGVATATFIEHNNFGLVTQAVPVFNIVPAPGEPARFGFVVGGVPVMLNAEVRSGEGYGVVVNVRNLPSSAQLLASTVTLWGTPGAAAHDPSRGTSCAYFLHEGTCQRPEALEEAPFLRLPTSCGAPLDFEWQLEPWNEPIGSEIAQMESISAYDVDGCSAVPFTPHLEVAPGTQRADTATPVNVRLSIPQKASEAPEGASEADVKNTTVALPAGLQLNPAAAAGLEGCSTQQIGYLGDAETGELSFTEESEAERSGETAPGTYCPEHSQLGTVRIKTPLLKEELVGAVYQAAQGKNPFGSLLAIYLIADAPKAGVRLRLAGEVKVQPDGQLVSNFPLTPQQPFEQFTLEFFGGNKAPLATSGCGKYETTSAIEPWSSSKLEPFTATPSSFFEVTSGPGGSSCSSVGGFAPGFLAGTSNNAGGAFSPFTLTLNRKDGEQTLSTVSMTMPPGLAGMISAVAPCQEAQANAGDCPAASKIGHVRVSAGVGGEPVVLPEAGKPEDPVYLTAPYKGAPFGLSIVAPAEAGPFNLGTVVVRGEINVDPQTAKVSIQSEPMPTRLQGIPLDVRTVEVVIDKSGFIFNPTNCESMSLTGAIGSSEGASENVSSHFRAAGCASLPFKAKLSATTHARHTRRNGAYLQVKVTSGRGQANIKSVFVELPKVLVSRTETLKLACSETQFAKNPAGCPAGAKVGTVVAHTPVLPVPVTGSAIFVSHGGAAFPDLDLVLHGDGVTIIQKGNTNIVKDITSSDFKAVPDLPLTSVEVTLPESAHSALAGTANLCTTTLTKRVAVKVHGKTVHRKRSVKKKRTLVMPTKITGQNGAVIQQNTKIAVLGCPKTGAHPKHKTTRKHKK